MKYVFLIGFLMSSLAQAERFQEFYRCAEGILVAVNKSGQMLDFYARPSHSIAGGCTIAEASSSDNCVTRGEDFRIFYRDRHSDEVKKYYNLSEYPENEGDEGIIEKQVTHVNVRVCGPEHAYKRCQGDNDPTERFLQFGNCKPEIIRWTGFFSSTDLYRVPVAEWQYTAGVHEPINSLEASVSGVHEPAQGLE